MGPCVEVRWHRGQIKVLCLYYYLVNLVTLINGPIVITSGTKHKKIEWYCAGFAVQLVGIPYVRNVDSRTPYTIWTIDIGE